MKLTRSKNKSKKTENVYDRLNVVVTLIAVSMVIAPYMYLLTFFNFSYPALFSFGLVISAVFTGYFFQWIFGTVTKIKRAADNNSYDTIENYFKPHQALINFIIALLVGIAMKEIIADYLKYRYETGMDQIFDKYSLTPYSVAILTTAAMITGIVVWFYPFGKIISIKTVIPLIAVFFINFMLITIYGGISQSFVTLSMLIFIICSFFTLNQSNILKTYRISRTVKITPSARLYNIKLILFVILGLAAILIITLSFITGIGVIVRIVLFFILKSVFQRDEITDDASDIARSFSDSVFNGLIDSMDINGNVSKMFFLLFFIIILCVIVFFILSHRREVWYLIKKFFMTLIQNVFDFLINVIDFNKPDKENYIILDYRDDEMKMDESAIKEYDPQKNLKKNNYRDFIMKLNTIQNDSEKIKFAYSVLIAYWKTANIGISDSDTPREIMAKILYENNNTDIEVITDVFESVKYAEINIEQQRSEKTLDSICVLLQRYLK